MSEQDVRDWPSSDTLVSYDSDRCAVLYTTISTGDVLHVVELESPDQECIVRPFWAEIPRRWWQRLLGWL